MRTVPNAATCPTLAAHAAPAGFLSGLKRGLAVLFPPRRRRQLLDARTLSDHLKRDIGMMDGNDPRGPRP